MRAVTVLVSPPEETPADRLFGEETGASRERIYNLNVLEDGTLVLLGRIRGDVERARAVLEAQPDILGFSISGTDGSGGLVFVHSRPPPAIARLVDLPREHEVFFEFPIEGTGDGRLELVVVGETNEALGRALADVPPEIDVTFERIGPYLEGGTSFAAPLTDRQREVLAVARDAGYYEVPRRATHHDIAERLDVSVATVGEHLQKIEARVFGDGGG